MPDLTRECRRCGADDWFPFAVAQPILAISCRACAAIDWIGFLPAEWDEYVTPLTQTGPGAADAH